MNVRDDLLAALRMAFRKGTTFQGMVRLIAAAHPDERFLDALAGRYIRAAFRVTFVERIPRDLSDARAGAFAYLDAHFLPDIVVAHPKWRDLPGGNGPTWFDGAADDLPAESRASFRPDVRPDTWTRLLLLARLAGRLQRRRDGGSPTKTAAPAAATAPVPAVPVAESQAPAVV